MKNKYDFTFFIQAKNCNPNGDPDLNNLPRMDEETMHGFITDVCLKRNIRDYIEAAFASVEGMDIIVKDATNINESIRKIVQDVHDKDAGKKVTKGITEKHKKVTEASAEACKRYFDVRTFGAVLSTGLNAGQVKGPVQLEFGHSLDPIFVKDITVTRNCYTDGKTANPEDYIKIDEEKSESEKRTMGRKQFIPYGLYVVHGYISATIAQKTGFSEKDLAALFEAILNMYNYSPSASKAGMSVVSPIIIFKHVGSPSIKDEAERTRSAMLGCAPAYKLHELIDIHKKDDVDFPRDYTDYEITVNKSALPVGVELGFKYMPFEDIVWGNPNDNWIKVI